MKNIDTTFLKEAMSETLEGLGENFYKGYGNNSSYGIPNLGGGDIAGLGDGNKFQMPSGKGQGSGQDKENQGTPAKPEYGNQENAKAASNAGPKNDTFSHEAKEDPASSEKVSLKVAGDVDALPKDMANKFEDPGTKENKRGKSMKKLKGGVKKLPNSVAESKDVMTRLSNAVRKLEEMASEKAEHPGPGPELEEAREAEEAKEELEMQKMKEGVIAYNPADKTQSIITLEQVKNKDYPDGCELYAYENAGESIKLTERVN
jgi:hypothetical protein